MPWLCSGPGEPGAVWSPGPTCTVCVAVQLLSSQRLPGLPPSLWHHFQGTPKQEGGGGDGRPALLNLKEALKPRSSLGMGIRQL